VLLLPIIRFIDAILLFFIFVIFARVIISWLVAFDVANRQNALVRGVEDLCERLTEPVLRPIRRFLPAMGGLDLSPLILLLLVYLVRDYLWVFAGYLT
jgi:YggT family protein